MSHDFVKPGPPGNLPSTIITIRRRNAKTLYFLTYEVEE